MSEDDTKRQMSARRLPISGTYNVRDIGGYRTVDGKVVKTGVLFRGDSLHRIDHEGRAILASLGIRTLIDLRDSDERRAYPDQLDGIDATVYWHPLVDGSRADRQRNGNLSLADAYRTILAERGERLTAAIRQLAAPHALPVFVHCMAGKDRTGLVVALVLSAIGVDERDIIEDYAASGLFLDAAYRSEATKRALARGLSAGEITAILASKPEYMESTLDWIRTRHRSVAAYLLAHGMVAEELKRLRESMVES